MNYQYPFKGRNRVTCEFGKIANTWKAGFHIGVDIVGDDDKTIYPIAPGTVLSINAHGTAYGNHVTVRHAEGNISLYAHMASINVKKGDAVTDSTKLGLMGATGNVSGAHLHLELHIGAYKYPATGSSPDKCSWLLNPIAWIEDHIKQEVDIINLEVEKDDQIITVESINYEGTNYVKFRDFEKLASVEIGYNETTKRPTISAKVDVKFKSYIHKYNQTSGNKVIAIHDITVWELDPQLLRAAIIKDNLNKVDYDYMTNVGYLWWEDPAKLIPYPLSILVSEGKVLGNGVPHQKATGCFIVRTDGTVEIKQVKNITLEKDVWFAIGGMTVAPSVLNVQEGFVDTYADVIRETSRVVIGWNEEKQKVIIAGYNKMSAARARDLLKELGCKAGITLDGGGSALMKEDGEYILKSDGRTQYGCIYLDM